ncbi:MAG TPA: aromatic ring-hydroxylating dioxygenase subunit alpha [Acidimicrobiales bacterium]|nr:aromatic ring-hydroxylating dioxygenase subunit alpha [Acidimicrobiales bacterium]
MTVQIPQEELMQTARPGEWVETAPTLLDLDFSRFRMRIDTDRYTSVGYQQRERTAIWMRVWQIAGRTDELPGPGDWKEYTILDQSFVIVRGNDGELRGFVNACRHRGNKICHGSGHAARITCPYHLWSYDLEGRLRGVARPDLVGPIDKGELGLLEVPVDTLAGFIFLNPDRNAPALAEYVGEELIAMLAPYRLDEMTTVLDVREAIDCNWKVVIDAFQEGYHIQGIHPELLRVIEVDPTTSRHRFFGDHSVACAPFEVANSGSVGLEEQLQGIRELPATFPGVAEVLPRFEELVDAVRTEDGTLELPEGVTPRTILQRATRETLTRKGLDVSGLTDAQMSDNHAFLLFPNFFMTIRAGEATVITAVPHPGGDPNRCVWHIRSYYWLTPDLAEAFRAPPVEVTEPGSYEYFLALQQDYVQMPRQQAGLRNSALEHMALVREEVNIADFHETVDRYLAASAS